MSTLKERSIKGILWELLGRIGLQGVGFVISIILARILVPEDFGILAILTVFTNLAAVFLDFGFSTALIQKHEVTEAHYSSVFYMNVAMGVVLAVLVFCGAPFFSSFYENKQLIPLIRFMSLAFIVNSFGNVLRARLRREMNFKVMSFASIISASISGVGAVYMAWAGFGVWSLAVQIVANQFLNNVLLYVCAPMRLHLKFDLQALKDLWSFSSRMFLSGLIDTLFINADSLIIGKLLNITTLGYYYRAKSLENFSMRYTAGSFAAVLLPGLSSLQNKPELFKTTVIKVFHLLSIISFLGCGLLLVSSRELIVIIFTDKWEPTVIMFQIIIAGAFALQIFNLFYNTLVSAGCVGAYLKINIFITGLLALNFSVLLFGGLTTYLVCFTLIRVLSLLIGIICVSRILKSGNILYVNLFKYFVVYSVSLLLVFFVKNYIYLSLYPSLFFSFFNFIFLYLILLYLINYQGFSLLLKEILVPLKRHIIPGKSN
jgi:O-antigen/teichoic acid export membrane protein